MVKSPVLIDIKINGVKRTIARTRRIIANIKTETNNTSEILIREAQRLARQEILAQTDGSGALADGIQVIKETTKQGKKSGVKYSLGFSEAVVKYAPAVHNGFRAHWVHKDMIADWLARHPEVKLRSKKWLEVGYPKTTTRRDGSPKQSAPWLVQGGVKFFDKAFAEILKISQETYTKRIKQAIKQGGK